MKIRRAKSSDRDEILSFCRNTFSWGDYIDRVWDYWFSTGRLLVVEDGGKRLAMSHVSLCPDGKSVWLEGVRVHPDYRRSKIATRLIENMLEYGRKNGARQASAIVDAANVVSRHMVEKNGFGVVSKWAYHSTCAKLARKKSAARLATLDDFDEIWRYLQDSKIYQLSARRYVNSWHWYTLDKKALRSFVKEKSLIVAGRPIDGIALINRHGYWDRKRIMQIVYLDSVTRNSLVHLVSFAANIYVDGEFQEFQIVYYDSRRSTPFIEKYMRKEEEHFLLYSQAI